MSGSDEFRELLFADLALLHGVAEARDVALALQRYWEGRGDPELSLASELAQIADLRPEQIAAVDVQVARLLALVKGDARRALDERGGIDRSIHAALSASGAHLSSALTAVGAGARAPLRALPTNRYIDFKPAGEGGMGLVYVALDTELNRTVAFKMVRPDTPGEQTAGPPTTPINVRTPDRDTPASEAFEELKARFLQEAWVTGGLEHPGIVPVYELGKTATGIPYYTMRFVRGQRTLRDALDDLRGCGIAERLKFIEPFLKLCDTVGYAHSRGVIHRDLKPENVALGSFGEVVLLDWGLAKLEGRQDMTASRWQARILEFREAGDLHTVAGAIGTPGYMAPEAALGRLDEVDAKSDVYSLGVLLFEILTGKPPFEFRTYAEFLDCMTTGAPPDPGSVSSEVPRALSTLCAACLSRDRAERPPDVTSVTKTIRAWQAASALEREVQALLRDAQGALDLAEGASAEERIRQVDRAAASLAQVRAKSPSEPGLDEPTAQVHALRERGVAERQRDSGRRLLRRMGVVALIVIGLSAVIVASVLEDRRQAIEQERDQVLRLADTREIRRLEVEAATLNPLDADLLQRTDAWRARSRALSERLPRHEAALAALRARASGGGPLWRFEDNVLSWQHDVLNELVRRLRALGDPQASSPMRISRLQRAAMTAEDPRWSGASERTAISPHYGGLRLAPQIGLVPLGADPVSGLEEFAHVLSGSLPMRSRSGGALIQAEDACIVLVLIPAGSLQIGAQATDPKAPGYAPGGNARANEGPVHRATVSACFVAKYECTQAQWAALASGTRPSARNTGQDLLRLPVETVSAAEAEEHLRASGLVLPTEPQWEWACRGGSTGLLGADAGEEERRRVAWTSENSETGTHAVGSKAANGFGLHDMLGNVWEWCGGWYWGYAHAAGKPIREPPAGLRFFRGGGWQQEWTHARPAYRQIYSASGRGSNLGLRPARGLTGL